MLLRGVFATVLIAALAWYRGALRSPRTSMMLPVALRVAAEVGRHVAFLTAIVNLPLANTSAIFQALPLAVTLGAALVFGETGRLAAVAGDHGRLRRRARHRPSGHRGVQRVSLFALVSVSFSPCAISRHADPADIPSLFITLVTTFAVTAVGAVILYPLGGWIAPSLARSACSRSRRFSAGRLSMRDLALRTGDTLGRRTVPLHRAVVGDALGYRRLRRPAGRLHAAGGVVHRRVRPLRLLPRTPCAIAASRGRASALPPEGV